MSATTATSDRKVVPMARLRRSDGLLVATLGFLAALELSFGPRIAVGEIALLIWGAWVVTARPTQLASRASGNRAVVTAAIAAIAGFLVTIGWSSAPITDTVRGLVGFVWVVLLAVALADLRRRSLSLWQVFVGAFGLARTIVVLVWPVGAATINPLKFGALDGGLFAYASTRLGATRRGACGYLLIAAVAGYVNYRSLLVIAVGTAGAAVLLSRRHRGARRRSAVGPAILLVTSGLIGIGVILASASPPETAREYGSSVLASRSEYRIAVPIIARHVLVGQGSDVPIEGDDVQRAAELAQDGIPAGIAALTRGTVPTHSHILQGALEGGILVGLFWVIVWLQLARLVWLGVVRPDSKRTMQMAEIAVVLYALWAIPFSPLGTLARVPVALAISVLLHRENGSSTC